MEELKISVGIERANLQRKKQFWDHPMVGSLTQGEQNIVGRLDYVNSRIHRHWFLFLHKKVNKEENMKLHDMHVKHKDWVNAQMDQYAAEEEQRKIEAGFRRPEVVKPPSCFPEDPTMIDIVQENQQLLQSVLAAVPIRKMHLRDIHESVEQERVEKLQKRLQITGINHVTADTLNYDRFDTYFYKRRCQYAECGNTKLNAMMFEII